MRFGWHAGLYTMQAYSIRGFFEPFGSLSHLIGALVFAGLSFSLLRQGRGDKRRVMMLGVFAFSCVLLLAMSGVYHMLPKGGTARGVLGRLDMAAIFVLIAGTYTPVQGLFFRGPARWLGLSVMWLLAITGITFFSIFYDHLPQGLGTGVYMLLGWIAGSAGLVAWRRQVTSEIGLLIGGGVAYTIGAILPGIGWPILIPGVVGPHEVWHIAVLVAMSMTWLFVHKNAHRGLDGPLVRVDPIGIQGVERTPTRSQSGGVHPEKALYAGLP